MELKGRYTEDRGFTILEVAFAMLISAILVWGIHYAYVTALETFINTSSRYQMKREGAMVLKEMEAFIRSAQTIYIQQPGVSNRSRLILRIPSSSGGGGLVEYYVDRQQNILYRNDSRSRFMTSRKRLLPWSVKLYHNQEVYPYTIEDMIVDYGDDDEAYSDFQFGQNNQGGSGNYIVKIQITMADTLGNTVTLNTWQSRNNSAF